MTGWVSSARLGARSASSQLGDQSTSRRRCSFGHGPSSCCGPPPGPFARDGTRWWDAPRRWARPADVVWRWSTDATCAGLVGDQKGRMSHYCRALHRRPVSCAWSRQGQTLQKARSLSPQSHVEIRGGGTIVLSYSLNEPWDEFRRQEAQDSRHGAKVLAGQRWVLASDRRTRSMPG